MDKNLRDIEKLFKAALEDNEEIPSSKVWNEIDKILDKDNIINIKKKYDTLKRISFLLLILLIALSIYEFTGNLFDIKIKGVNGRIDKEIVTENNSNFSIEKNNKTNSESIAKNNNTAISSSIKDINTKPGQLKSFVINKKEKAFDDTSPLGMHKKIQGLAPLYQNKNVKEEEQGQAYNNNSLETNIAINLPHILSPSFGQRPNKITIDTIRIKVIPKSLDSNKTTYSADIGITKLKTVKTKERKTSRLSFSVFFSPDFAYYRLKNDKHNNQSQNLIDIEEGEKHEFSSTAGALLDFKVNRHLSLQSGITFSNISIIAQPQTIFAQQDVSGNIKYRLNTSSGYGYVLPSFSSAPQLGDSLYAFTSAHTLQYLSLPLSVKYNITRGKFNFNAFTGIGINHLIRGKIETTVENETENETEVIKKLQGLKKIYFSGLTGLGIDYNLNKKIALTFNPSFKFALNSINKNSPVKSYPNSFGLGFGIILKL